MLAQTRLAISRASAAPSLAARVIVLKASAGAEDGFRIHDGREIGHRGSSRWGCGDPRGKMTGCDRLRFGQCPGRVAPFEVGDEAADLLHRLAVGFREALLHSLVELPKSVGEKDDPAQDQERGPDRPGSRMPPIPTMIRSTPTSLGSDSSTTASSSGRPAVVPGSDRPVHRGPLGVDQAGRRDRSRRLGRG